MASQRFATSCSITAPQSCRTTPGFLFPISIATNGTCDSSALTLARSIPSNNIISHSCRSFIGKAIRLRLSLDLAIAGIARKAIWSWRNAIEFLRRLVLETPEPGVWKRIARTVGRPARWIHVAMRTHDRVVIVDLAATLSQIPDYFFGAIQLRARRLVAIEIADQTNPERDVVEIIA